MVVMEFPSEGDGMDLRAAAKVSLRLATQGRVAAALHVHGTALLDLAWESAEDPATILSTRRCNGPRDVCGQPLRQFLA
jgi:hypothetical protein